MSSLAFRRNVPSYRAFAAAAGVHDAAAWRWRHFDNKAAAAPPGSLLPKSMPVQPEGHKRAKAVITHWPEYTVSPMHKAPQQIRDLCGIGELWLKDESDRLGVGSFKALGGGVAVAHAIAKMGTKAAMATASAGNHGVGVAWACKTLGGAEPTPCHVFLHKPVGELIADRIRSFGATVHRVDGMYYEDALAAARQMAEKEGWTMVQDVTWDGYTQVPQRIFEGYTMLAEEMIEQFEANGSQPPTHVLVNSGIGGLSTGVFSHLWAHYGAERPRFIAVEPLAADCLLHAARDGNGKVVQVPGSETTIQVGLDVRCGDPYTWPFLSSAVNDFVAIGDECVQPWCDLLANELSPPIFAGHSAVSGLGVLQAAAAQPKLRIALGLSETSRVAVIICEGVAK